MKITREEVRRVALLARLQLTPEEEELLTGQLDAILSYMETLDRPDTEKVEPLAHAVDVVNAFREDRVVHEPQAEELLANAPAKENSFFKVPKIIE